MRVTHQPALLCLLQFAGNVLVREILLFGRGRGAGHIHLRWLQNHLVRHAPSVGLLVL